MLVLDVHHLVFDNESLGVICRDLETGYAACLGGSASEVAPTEQTHGDAWLAADAWRTSDPEEDGVRFWRSADQWKCGRFRR